MDSRNRKFTGLSYRLHGSRGHRVVGVELDRHTRARRSVKAVGYAERKESWSFRQGSDMLRPVGPRIPCDPSAQECAGRANTGVGEAAS